MLLVFVSNYLNYHQLPLAKAFLARGIDYRFVATEPAPSSDMKSDGLKMNDIYPFVIKTYESQEKMSEALKLIDEADVLISGGFPFKGAIRKRSKAGKITFIYTERFFRSLGKGQDESFKNKIHYLLSAIKNQRMFNQKNIYYLASSAYLKGDLNRHFHNSRPVYRWGYFPPMAMFEKEEINKRNNSVPELIFCGRFLNWKNPLLAVQASEALLSKGYKNHLTMIGSGELLESTKQYVKEHHLEDNVAFLGNIPSSDVPKEMAKGDILLLPSTSSEGWGAVINEGMSLGLVPIVSKTVGSAPFLIKDGVNGLLFEEGNLNDLVAKIEILLNDHSKMKEMAVKAYERIREEYNAEVSASRFLTLCDSIKNGKDTPFDEGVCSLA